MRTSDNHHNDSDDCPPAVRSADTGAQAWRQTVHAQRASAPDHVDFYAIAAEVVDTLRSLDFLAGLLAGQVAAYPGTVTAAGGELFDDQGAVPEHRLRSAVLALAETRQALSAAERAANRYWSAISYIGVEHRAPAATGSTEVAP
ncbi:hypothetical protein I4I84_23085 [Pseudonocardia sp. KRD-182]|uniref:hypothetical protein n=1 Tax=Pseudonocardia oceani TaxID=2792013 RepID=UPI001C4A7218|nr:hypothetical protein [Pseudonocardia oceani]MBW0111599.1 hypothetical protein [Pseudonocardia oceani]